MKRHGARGLLNFVHPGPTEDSDEKWGQNDLGSCQVRMAVTFHPDNSSGRRKGQEGIEIRVQKVIGAEERPKFMDDDEKILA